MKVGLIGAGLMGLVHTRGWAQQPGTLTGVYAPNGRARAFAARFALKAFGTLDELLSEVDIVDICTPTPVHAQYAVQAARAGKHVICEKPLAPTLREADQIIQAVQESGVRLFVAHVLRFFPHYRAAWAQVQAGAVGRPVTLRLSRVGTPPTPGSWLLDESRSGGVPLDLMIHDLDFARWVTGEVQSVHALECRRDGLVMVQATLHHVSGAVSLVEGGWAAPPGVFRTALDIAGTTGVIEWTSDAPQPLTSFAPPAPLAEQQGASLPALGADDPYAAELWHALQAMEHATPFLIEAADARASLALALAVSQSIRTGQVVEVGA